MEDIFKLEIISPEKIIFSEDVKMVTLPSYEGDMGVLKNHISIITFLRPGIIKIQKNDGNFEEFFVQDGTIEYFNDSLVVLSTSVIKVQKKEGNINDFFVQDGTVEYFNNNLIVLSASAMNIKDLSKEFVDNLNKDTQEKLTDKNITDHDRYILNHKLNVLKEVRI